MPPGTSDDQRDEYASIIKEISSDGAGVYPDGGEIHTVETSAANADAFSSRAEWCDKALVRRATGGLLTVLAESGSDTLAGSAHMEAFRQIAANDAISIAECINRQYVRRRIAAQFPGQPVLVYFKLTPPVINDRAATVQMLCQLAGQRWRATDEAVSEEVGMEVHTEAQNAPQPEALANRSSEQQSAEDSPGEAPLTAGELAALRALGGELNPNQIAADADYMTREMLAGLREPMANRGDGETEELVLLFESLEIRKASPLTNCNQHGHDADCPGPAAAGAPEKEAALAKVRDTEDGQTMGSIFGSLSGVSMGRRRVWITSGKHP